MARVLLILAVALGAAAAGFWAWRLGGPLRGAPAQPALTSAPTASAAAEPPAPSAVPEALPNFTLADRDGRPRRLADWRGRPLIVNFWATWCAPCRREIPLLVALRAERRPQNLEVIGIAVDFREEVLKYAAEIGLDYPLLIGETDGLAAVEAFGMETVFPFTAFADRQHRILALKVGELHRDEADFILDRVREVDSGTLSAAAARTRIASRLRELAAERARRRATGGSESE